MNKMKRFFLEEARLVLCTKETIPFVGPALAQVESAQKEGDFWPNVDQGTLFLGIGVCDCNRRLQFTRHKRVVPLCEKFG